MRLLGWVSLTILCAAYTCFILSEYRLYRLWPTRTLLNTSVDKQCSSIMARGPYKLLLQGSPNLERGSYPCSRTQITVGMFRSVLSIICRRSTMALFGAFLIHVILGTFYTLSNINSYMTSYIRKHGFPSTTYGGAIWISSAFAIGQGTAMVFGGFVERRFSARVSCFIGCTMFSASIMATSWSLKFGLPGIVLTYGLIPGLGTGMSYMTPLSNGFGWFPQNRRGFVAGTILAGFGIGTFVFNLVQTAYVNPDNLSPNKMGYFDQDKVLDRVPDMLLFIGGIYGAMQFVGCCLLFKPPLSIRGIEAKRAKKSRLANNIDRRENENGIDHKDGDDDEDDDDYDENVMDGEDDEEAGILSEGGMSISQVVKSQEFLVLFAVYGIITQGVLFVNAVIKNYGQFYISDDLYLSWTGSMASIANGLGRIVWGLAIDRLSFSTTFTSITLLFAFFILTLPFKIVLSNKTLYMIWTLGIFGSFSGWMAIYPVQIAREFGRTNSALIYGLIFISQSFGSIVTAFTAHYILDTFSRYVPCLLIVLLEVIGLAVYHLFYPQRI